MVRIRLRRTGKKKQPSYRVVVADSESPRDGRFIENIGFYNPRTDPPTIEIKEDRAQYWLSQGAQPSDAVARLLRKKGVLQGPETAEGGEATEATPEPTAEAEEVESTTEATPEPTAEAEEVESTTEAEPVPEIVETDSESEPAGEAE